MQRSSVRSEKSVCTLSALGMTRRLLLRGILLLVCCSALVRGLYFREYLVLLYKGTYIAYGGGVSVALTTDAVNC